MKGEDRGGEEKGGGGGEEGVEGEGLRHGCWGGGRPCGEAKHSSEVNC